VTVTTRGRPRAFDRDEVLAKAIEAFWEHGFEATSVAELTKAMGISPPSLYATFGDKKALFLEAVAVYQRTHGSFAARALASEPTARSAVARLLREAASEYTDPAHPRGCMVISAATNCTPDSADIEQALRDERNANVAAIQQRIQSDIDSGVLPSGTNARSLAVFVAATVQGMSQQARDGASRSDLEAVAEAAMRAWPT
jgi:TetR/AcrR family transcriptional regulator, copper-responsive repressor